MLLLTIHLIRKNRLREEYALLWFVTFLGLLLLAIFTKLAAWLASFFEVSHMPTLFLAFGMMLTYFILLSLTLPVSRLSNNVRDLVQSVAMLEWRLQQLEQPRQATVPTDEGSLMESPTNHLEQKLEEKEKRPLRPGKVLVIGLDGATYDLIKPWVMEGCLPTFARLLRQGASGNLCSTTPPMTAPAWTAFATGSNPGKHGLYDWIARQPGTYQFTPVTSLDCAVPTLYELLSRAGRKVCTLNIPMTYPPIPVNGLMVSGMPAPSSKVTLTYPKELYQDILQHIGDYILYPDPGQAYSDSGIDAFLKRLYRTTDLRVQTFEYLLQREAWDFGMVVFSGTDTISHAMWKFMDCSHPLHDPAKYGKYGNAIRDYYIYVDGLLAQLLKQVDEDTTLLIMSDHGFGPFHKFIHVNNWLMQEGLMKVQNRPFSRLKHTLFRLGFAPMNIYNLLMSLGLGALKREVVRGQGQGLLKTFFLSFEDVDWGRTVAYSLGNVGQIRLNVIGREPHGCVQPGAEYNKVREDIIARLSQLRDPKTGEAVVETIYRREEIYSGDQLEQAADIIFIPRRLEYFGFGEYEFGSHKIIEAMQRGISGTHRMNGVFLAYGAGIKPGSQVEGARLIDLAPTIFYLMGLPVPAHMDGRILHEIFRDDFEPFQSVPPTNPLWENPGGPAGTGLDEADQQIIAERLRSLGYVG